MLTRKQRWRRTRTRKNAWGDLPQEVMDAMLAGAGGGLPKSVSWDHSYAAGLKIRADKAAEVARQGAAKEDLRLKAAAAAVAVAGSTGRGDIVQIPRSVSCSSLAPKRTLFPRSSSKEEFSGPRRESTSTAAQRHRRRMLPLRKEVSFDTQVKMVLIPKREEFSEADRIRLWWGREDYSRFRQVLIDWKRVNSHRISPSDNILSINLSDLDEEEDTSAAEDQKQNVVLATAAGYNFAHDEAAAAADAIAAAAAAAAAKAAAEAAKAAAATEQANAAATAAAAAAATAAEVAVLNAEEVERDRLDIFASVVQQPQEDRGCAAAAPPQHQESGGDSNSAADPWEQEVSKARAAAAIAAAGGVIRERLSPEFLAGEDGNFSDIQEVQEEEDIAGVDQVAAEGLSKTAPIYARGRASFTNGTAGDRERAEVPEWSIPGANGTFPLRRANTFGQNRDGPLPSPGGGGSDMAGRLKEVQLSELQATTESLRAWRKNFDALNALGSDSHDKSDSDGEDEEDRGRAMSLQQQSRSYAQRGRATALVLSRTQWASDVAGSAPGAAVASAGDGCAQGSGAAAAASGGAANDGGGAASGGRCANQEGRPHQQEKKQQQQQQQQQQLPGEKQLRNLSDQDERSVFLASPVMAAFERERSIAAQRQTEFEEAQAARASAMVKAAAEELAESKQGSSPRGNKGAGPGSVVQLGLNDVPGSAAAASAAGLRIAADGISNLSLRSKDSVENLQELGEQWGQVPLSSSA